MTRTQQETSLTEPLGEYRYALQWIVDDALLTTPPNGVWVEVGVGIGRGIAYMARALLRAGRDDVTLYAVDPWAGTARCGQQQDSGPASRHGDWQLFLRTMSERCPEELSRIHVLRLTSEAAAAAILASLTDRGQEPRPLPIGVDLCIVDGAHDYDSVRLDLSVWEPLMRRGGGVIGGDDMVTGSDVERAVLEMWPDVERRGDPNSDGAQHTWPTFRKILR